jgi:RNA polymerase sigma factor (sigma-70 family)
MTATSGRNGPEALVDRCVKSLLDDYARQGNHLGLDDVTRVLSRRKLTPELSSTVWERLAAAGITIERLDADLQAYDESRGRGGRTVPDAPIRARPGSDRSELDYPHHRLLDHEREIQLARRFQAARNLGERWDPNGNYDSPIVESGRKAREELILSNIRLVFSCAKAFTETTSLAFDDLVQEGILGLLRAVDRYDPEKGFRFSTYATWWINQSIGRALNNDGHIIRVPSHVLARIRQLNRKKRRLSQRLRREPSARELAHELGWEIKKVNFLLQIKKDAQPIQDVLEGRAESKQRAPLFAKSEPPTRAVEREELKSVVSHVLSSLDARAQRILVYRFGLLGEKPRTLQQVGRRLGITRERVRQIEKKALQRIAHSGHGRELRPYATGGTDGDGRSA